MEKGELVAQTKRVIWRSMAAFSFPDVFITKLSILDTMGLCLFAGGSRLIGKVARSLSSKLTISGMGVFGWLRNRWSG